MAHAVDTDEMLRAVIDFLRIWREQAPVKVRTTWGTIYRDDRFPLVHQANLGWVATPPEGGSKKIIEDLGEAFRGTAVPHQALLFEDAERAFALQEEFHARKGLALLRVVSLLKPKKRYVVDG